MIFHSYVSLPEGKCHHFPHFFWLVVDLPLWKIWVRQLGWWHSQLNGKIKFMFQTTNQSCSLWKTTITYSWTTIKPPLNHHFPHDFLPPGSSASSAQRRQSTIELRSEAARAVSTESWTWYPYIRHSNLQKMLLLLVVVVVVVVAGGGGVVVITIIMIQQYLVAHHT